jgi:cold shock CspA family protein
MDLKLIGKIKTLSSTFGVIESVNYDEEHLFIKSDINNADIDIIKIGDTVTYHLKTSKGRSEATKISIVRIGNFDKKGKKSQRPRVGERDYGQRVNLENIIDGIDPVLYLHKIQSIITEGLFIMDRDNEKLIQTIKLIVRDNSITNVEAAFLKNKTKELGFDDDLVEDARRYLNSNNPYFDDILYLIFKDGIINKDEIDFLIEKSHEHKFQDSYSNTRFWQYAFKFHLMDLMNSDDFVKIIKLFHRSLDNKLPIGMQKDWLLLQLNIFENNDWDKLLSNAVEKIETSVKEKYKNIKIDFEDFYQKIEIDTSLEVKIGSEKSEYAVGREKGDISEHNDNKHISIDHNQLTVDENLRINEIAWNTDIVPLEFKEEILNLIREGRINDASQAYLSLAYQNGEGDFNKVGEEFERIIEILFE